MTRHLVKLTGVSRTFSKGKWYYYHKPTRTRLPDNPNSQEFMARVVELNGAVAMGAVKNHDEGKYKIVRDDNRKGFIYFIQAESGPVKIGWTRSHPKRRLGTIQSSHFEKLRLLSFCPGTQALEQNIHKALKSFCIRGEWFKPVDDVFELMAEPMNKEFWSRAFGREQKVPPPPKLFPHSSHPSENTPCKQ